ncbi:MAG: enoyl-CoA hydratase [Hyphomicrobiaceae bacterium]|nr:enoyl-CoA hydratase [Hyphomicrobiaceae bacterium]
MGYQTILVENRGKVSLITLNRPQALNALNGALIGELTSALAEADADERIGAIVITGSEKAFAAGADIKEMAELDFATAFKEDFIASWSKVAETRKPVIAAVAGYALGGGCELAMMCDFIIAAENAKFGQPEVNLGVIPGAGGTQRLARYVGKAKAMDLVLTARQMDAAEAERCGLAARVVPLDDLIDTALAAADKIASLSQPVVMMAKEALNRSFEMPLSEGLRYERRLFHALFATEDQKEGMSAFVDKRKAQFKNR